MRAYYLQQTRKTHHKSFISFILYYLWIIIITIIVMVMVKVIIINLRCGCKFSSKSHSYNEVPTTAYKMAWRQKLCAPYSSSSPQPLPPSGSPSALSDTHTHETASTTRYFILCTLAATQFDVSTTLKSANKRRACTYATETVLYGNQDVADRLSRFTYGSTD